MNVTTVQHVIQRVFTDSAALRAFVEAPEQMMAEHAFPEEERRALLRLHARLEEAVASGAMLLNPLGVWP